MVRDKDTLSKAVELLNETEDALQRLKVSRRSRGSARVLSVKVRMARDLLVDELKRPHANWSNAVVLLRETAKLVVELLFDNIQYKSGPRVCGYEVFEFGARAFA